MPKNLAGEGGGGGGWINKSWFLASALPNVHPGDPGLQIKILFYLHANMQKFG